jgi:hypothetical protein
MSLSGRTYYYSASQYYQVKNENIVRNAFFLEISPSSVARATYWGCSGPNVRKTAQSAARVTIIVSQQSYGLKLLAEEPRQRVKCPSQPKERGLYVGETA